MLIIFVLASLSLLTAIAWIWTSRVKRRTTKASLKMDGQALLPKSDVKPLLEFNWETMEPQKFRPFKPIYYITMALRSTIPSDLIVIDRNYQSRLRERQLVMEKHENHTIGCMPYGVEAVQEAYSYLLGEYLPARYPTLFTRDDKSFRNRVTGMSLPLLPPEDPITALRNLGQTVEDDMFFLRETPDGHQSIAFVCCCPSGFDPAAKLGKSLKEIHEPVPSYEKIGPSMERYFSRLEVGKGASRVNWSVTTNSELFNVSGNHVNEGDQVESHPFLFQDLSISY
ncbi:hypothetical protein F4781DRAFT_411040 [Annulohypoxylon bovei var. microspora]|nr:hypothetical protein F4781DRAFT_411040 [Annulohypoxylon bovei var. microspora]